MLLLHVYQVRQFRGGFASMLFLVLLEILLKGVEPESDISRINLKL